MSQCAQQPYNSTPTQKRTAMSRSRGCPVRGRRRRRPDSASREVQRDGLTRGAAGGRGAAGRSDTEWAGALAASWECGSSPAASSSVSRATRQPRNTSVLSARRRVSVPTTARSTCSTSRWVASRTASPMSRHPATRSSSPTRPALELGMAVCYDLRFPELFRIMARARRDASSRCPRRSPSRPAAPTGRSCARARDREPGLRDRARARSGAIRPITKATGTR